MAMPPVRAADHIAAATATWRSVQADVNRAIGLPLMVEAAACDAEQRGETHRAQNAPDEFKLPCGIRHPVDPQPTANERGQSFAPFPNGCHDNEAFAD